MASRFQAASLVASPSYPNAIAWSDENLVAVASGHLVTILNPDMPFGPRGLITIPADKPFPIGVIERKDLLTGGMLPISLYRDLRPCVRSISWSPIGFAPNSGCLLAVCTTEGRVKLYRFPFCEFSAEWVEVMDISEMLCNYLENISFWELDVLSEISNGQASQHGSEHRHNDELSISELRKNPKRRRPDELSLIEHVNPSSAPHSEKSVNAFTEIASYPSSLLREGSSVEVLMLNGDQRVWVGGMLTKLDGNKALVIFPEVDGKGKQHKWVELGPCCGASGPHLPTKAIVDQENQFPIVRPIMKVENLPEKIFLGNCHGLEGILKVGQAIEAWSHDRWFEGMFMGVNESGVLVELYGDTKLVTLDTASIRLAPVWINDLRTWQMAVVKIKMNSQDLHNAFETADDNLKGNRSIRIVSMAKPKDKRFKKRLPETCNLPLISADEYASRISMLSSLLVAWSPLLQTTVEFVDSLDGASSCCSILAVGGKSGRISLWKFHKPKCFSVVDGKNSTTAMLIGIHHAHRSWITVMSWAPSVSDSSGPQLLLASGCSDGSVKIWQWYTAELVNSSETSHVCFTLFHEVIPMNSVPISVLSLTVAVHSTKKLVLAVGKGSGCFEVWMCDILTRKFHKTGSYDVHSQIVTGFAWAFDGRCLYSCSQDDSVRCWIVNEDFLCEVPLPPNTPGAKSSSDVPNIFDSCFGLAVSPGNLVIAVARSFDLDHLNPMYQSRSQKAAVEFFWIGGQQLNKFSNEYSEFSMEACPSFSEEELALWMHNILWSLKQHEHLNKPLVIWDAVAALVAFKKFAPEYVDGVLAKWLCSYIGSKLELSTGQMLSTVSDHLSTFTSRQLHLLNIISRCVILMELNADTVNTVNQSYEGIFELAKEMALWMDLLKSSEKELRERLVGCNFSAVMDLVSLSSENLCKLGYWRPVGLVQMGKWVESNHDNVRNSLKVLKSKVGEIEKSKLSSVSGNVAEEQCSYCSAPVPFESAESALCQGSKCNNEVGQRHKLTRCAASMLVIDTTPSWFCVCCHRRTSKPAPSALFTMLSYPKGNNDSPSSITSSPQDMSNPLCVFCGILLQRLQPEFLLSVSPV